MTRASSPAQRVEKIDSPCALESIAVIVVGHQYDIISIGIYTKDVC